MTVTEALVSRNAAYSTEVLARGEVVGIQIGQLETATGEEDLDPLLDALSPVLDAVG